MVGHAKYLSGASVGGTSTAFEFGSMRNRSNQRPGKPVPMGERPADRPMAEHLGNGRNFGRIETSRGEGSLIELGDAYFTFGMAKPNDPTHFRRATGLALFSWEMPASTIGSRDNV